MSSPVPYFEPFGTNEALHLAVILDDIERKAAKSLPNRMSIWLMICKTMINGKHWLSSSFDWNHCPSAVRVSLRLLYCTSFSWLMWTGAPIYSFVRMSTESTGCRWHASTPGHSPARETFRFTDNSIHSLCFAEHSWKSIFSPIDCDTVSTGGKLCPAAQHFLLPPKA